MNRKDNSTQKGSGNSRAFDILGYSFSNMHEV